MAWSLYLQKSAGTALFAPTGFVLTITHFPLFFVVNRQGSIPSGSTVTRSLSVSRPSTSNSFRTQRLRLLTVNHSPSYPGSLDLPTAKLSIIFFLRAESPLQILSSTFPICCFPRASENLLLILFWENLISDGSNYFCSIFGILCPSRE